MMHEALIDLELIEWNIAQLGANEERPVLKSSTESLKRFSPGRVRISSGAGSSAGESGRELNL